MFPIISDLQGPAAQLATSAATRLLHGFRPSTFKQYTRMWSDFQAFKVAAGLQPSEVTVHILLAFMEYLSQNKQSKSTISNYMAAIRAFHIIYACDTVPFKDQRISWFLKSLQITAPLTPKIRTTLNIEVLTSIVQICANLEAPAVFIPLYLTCFFSFLRLSNILPHTIHTFDVSRQLARGDLIISKNSALLIIKWSKTIQNRKDIVTLPLPHLGASLLCPIAALNNMIHLHPASQNDPLFILPRSAHHIPLTDSIARKHLKMVSQLLHISPTLTFHAFRRAGASWAFHNGVPLEFIKKHGTWKSDAIHTYLTSNPSFTSPVSLAFAASLYS